MNFERSMNIFFHYKLVFETNIIFLRSLKGIIAYIKVGIFKSSGTLNKIFEIIHSFGSAYRNNLLFQMWCILLCLAAPTREISNMSYKGD